jgi:hypothetical protein
LPQQQLTVFEEHPAVLDAGVLPARVDFLLCAEVHHHSSFSVGPQHSADHLFAGPQHSRLEDGGGRQVDDFVCVGEPRQYFCELLARKEDLSAGYKERCGQEILNESYDGLATLGSDDVLSHSHEVLGFGSRLDGLRNMDVHFVAVEVCVERSADALVEAQSPSLADLDFEAHHADSVQTGLPVEDDDVPVPEMPLNSVPHPELDLPPGGVDG